MAKLYYYHNGEKYPLTVGEPPIDETLTQEGEAADAKATGDAIGTLSSLIADIDGLPPVTIDDDGKVLGVVDGEWSSISNIQIDSTLTQSGQAADAKATGDAISQVSSSIADTLREDYTPVEGDIRMVNGHLCQYTDGEWVETTVAANLGGGAEIPAYLKTASVSEDGKTLNITDKNGNQTQFTPPAGGAPVDTTLQKSGFAADAQTVGNIITVTEKAPSPTYLHRVPWKGKRAILKSFGGHTETVEGQLVHADVEKIVFSVSLYAGSVDGTGYNKASDDAAECYYSELIPIGNATKHYVFYTGYKDTDRRFWGECFYDANGDFIKRNTYDANAQRTATFTADTRYVCAVYDTRGNGIDKFYIHDDNGNDLMIKHEYVIPAEIRALDGYGQSNGTAVNVVDLENKMYHKAGSYVNGAWVADVQDIDISDYLTESNVIEVSEGAFTKLVNEGQLEVPADIEYVVTKTTAGKAAYAFSEYVNKAISHRGDTMSAPENTLPAYRKAAHDGLKFMECDIHTTSDGVKVLLHDDTINRTARNADGTEIAETIKISDITYAQALEYDFGIWKAERFAGTKIPTLKEFLYWCRDARVFPCIELKSEWASREYCRELMQLVDEAGMRTNVAWLSSNIMALRFITEIDPHAYLSVVGSIGSGSQGNMVIEIAKYLQTGQNEVNVCLTAGNINQALVDNFAANGIPLGAWEGGTNFEYVTWSGVPRALNNFADARYNAATAWED